MKELITSLEQIANETNGIKLGEPWKRSDKSLGAIVPILSEVSIARTYTMMQDAEKAGKIKIEDTGSISGVKVNNTGDKPIFVRQGAMFKGNTQERAASVSYVIDAQELKEVEVYCVHQSRGISQKAPMSYSGHVAPAKVSCSMSRGQGAVWSNVARYSSSLRMSASSGGMHASYASARDDDLMGVMEAAKQDFDKVIGKVECHENQVGIIVFDEEGISGIEFFDHPDSWKAFHEEVIKSHIETLIKESKSGIYKLDVNGLKDELKGFVSKVRHATFKLHNETKDSETFVMRNGMSGEYTLLKGKLVHALILSENNKDTEDERRRQYMTPYGPISPGLQFVPQVAPQYVPPNIVGFGEPYPNSPPRINPNDCGTPLKINPNDCRHIPHINPYDVRPRKRKMNWYEGNYIRSSSFIAKTSKMGGRTIINVPSSHAKMYSGSSVYVEYAGKKKGK